MAEPARNPYDDENDQRSWSARERANARWGIGKDSDENEEGAEPQSPSSARKRANKQWGMSTEELAAAEKKPDAGSTESVNDAASSEMGQLGETNTIPYKPSSRRGLVRRLRGASKGRRAALTAIGGGSAIGAIIAGVTLVSFLGSFRLDHILQNIDAKTFSRFNASLSGRSNAYVRSYVKLRMLEYGNNSDHFGDADGNLYLKAAKVDTGNPMTDWYRTMRNSKFESNLASSDGIVFSSVLGTDGKLKPVIFKFKDDSIDISRDPQVTATMNKIEKDFNGGKNINTAALSQHINELGPQMDQFLDREIFKSPKSARREIGSIVRDKTYFFQVFKRRHLRQDIYNRIGLRNWSFFETTRDKYLAKKQNIQQKIVQRTFPGEGQLSSFLKCVLGGTGCNTTEDPNNPKNTPNELDDTGSGKVDDQNTGELDEDGKPIKQGLDGDELANGIEKELEDQTGKEAAKDATDATTNGTITSRLIKSIIKSYVGEEAADSVPEDPGKWWRIFQRIAKFDDMVKSHKLSLLVKKARMAQYLAIYAMYATARDQVKTGQLSADEYQAMIKTTDDFDVSEGWQEHIDGPTVASSGTVFAASATPDEPNPGISKADYCKPGHDRKKGDYAYLCDDEKPNGGSNAATLENAYNNSVGYLVHPIAQIVHGINATPIGKGITFLSNFTSKIIGAVSDVTIVPVLNALGITKGITQLATLAMEKFLQFAGVVPIFDGSKAGAANYLIAGSAGTAEGGTRQAGGVVSTPKTLNYSNQLAADYQKQQADSESLFDRYASLDNPTSLFSTALYNVASTNLTSSAHGFLNTLTSLPASFGHLLSGRVLAANTDSSASGPAEWAGVDTYDIPQQCQELDPLDPNYLDKATNADQVSGDSSLKGSKLGWATMRDSKQFWTAVYDKLPGDDTAQEAKAETIYNCALLDRQVQGSMGAVYGYTDDGGFSNDAVASSPDSSNGGAITTTGCPSGPVTEDQTVVVNGIRVHPCIAQHLTDMMAAASKDGITLSGGGWRSVDSQVNLRIQHGCGGSQIYDRNCKGNPVTAVPGKSRHESGAAVDFSYQGETICYPLISARCHGNAAFDWLVAHAGQYGFKNLSSEAWHWSDGGG